MPWEPPPRSERRPRPDAAARRRALGLASPTDDVPLEPPAPAAPASALPPAVRESLRDSLARIPDLVNGQADPVIDTPRPAPRERSSITATGLGARAASTAPAAPAAAAPTPSPTAPARVSDPRPVDAPAAEAPLPASDAPAGRFDKRSAAAVAAAAADRSVPTSSERAASIAAADAAVLAATAAAGVLGPPGSPPVPARRSPFAKADAPYPSVAGTAAPLSPPLVDAKGRTVAPHPRPPLWRRLGFAVVVVGLVASIPVLGYKGYRIISNSTSGTFTSTSTNPSDPGYEAQVDPTPTAVVIQYDVAHEPVGVTFLSLSAAAGGGGVVFVPLDTEVASPGYGVNRLRGAYDALKNRPTLARDQLSTEVGRLLNVSIGETVELDAAGWTQLVAPVAPLEIDNPEPVVLADGVTIPSGNTPLSAEQVGPYLAARKDGESDLARLNRSETVWSAWLAKVHAANDPAAVPGETTAGMGRFAQSLAKGQISFATLPVDRIIDATGRYRIRKGDVNDLVSDIVPSPTPAYPGSRFTVRLLDGVAPGTVSLDLTRQIVHLGGSVSVLGNGPRFGMAKTEIVFVDPTKKALAKIVLEALGGTGSVRLDRGAPDTVDFTIVLGKDILGESPSPTASTAGASTTAPGTTVPGSTPGFTTTSGGT